MGYVDYAALALIGAAAKDAGITIGELVEAMKVVQRDFGPKTYDGAMKEIDEFVDDDKEKTDES